VHFECVLPFALVLLVSPLALVLVLVCKVHSLGSRVL